MRMFALMQTLFLRVYDDNALSLLHLFDCNKMIRLKERPLNTRSCCLRFWFLLIGKFDGFVVIMV